MILSIALSYQCVAAKAYAEDTGSVNSADSTIQGSEVKAAMPESSIVVEAVRSKLADDASQSDVAQALVEELANKGYAEDPAGLADLFGQSAEALGLACVCVKPEENATPWNMVELDGSWYHVDIASYVLDLDEKGQGARDEVAKQWLFVSDDVMALHEGRSSWEIDGDDKGALPKAPMSLSDLKTLEDEPDEPAASDSQPEDDAESGALQSDQEQGTDDSKVNEKSQRQHDASATEGVEDGESESETGRDSGLDSPQLGNSSEPEDAYAVNDASRASASIASGNWNGKCEWSISDKGVLYIFGPSTGGDSLVPWSQYASQIKEIKLSYNTELAENCELLFSGCSNVTEIDFSFCNTAKVKNASCMFMNCSNLRNVFGLNLKSVTNMSNTYKGCHSLENIGNEVGWNTSNVTNMEGTFDGCKELAVIGVTNWDTSKVETFKNMFRGCSKLKYLYPYKWQVSQAYDLSGMFEGCSRLEYIELKGGSSGGTTTNASAMMKGCSSITGFRINGTLCPNNTASMFYGCTSLKSLDLANWWTPDITDTRSMFYGCSALESLDVSGDYWYTYSNTSTSNMFTGCNKLSSIKVGKNYVSGSGVIPAATSTNGRWWSTKDSRWYTVSEIGTSRKKIADTYQNYEIRNLANATISTIGNDLEYMGSPVTPEPVVKHGGTTLKKDVDYTLSYKNNTGAGVGTVTATGKGNCTGSISTIFGIKAVGNVPFRVVWEDNNNVLGKRPRSISWNIDVAYTTAGGMTEIESGIGVNWNASSNWKTNVSMVTKDRNGKAPTVRPSATIVDDSSPYDLKGVTGNVNSGYVFTFAYGKRQSIGSASISVNNQTYNGNALTPKPTVMYGKTKLAEGRDYSLRYANNKNAGKATVYVDGKGVFTGTKSATFTINPKSVTVAAKNLSKTYGAKDPLLTASVSGLVGSDKVSYNVTRKSGDAVGSYAITVSGAARQGNYQVNYKGASLKIVAANISSAQISGVASQTYDGKAKTPKPAVTIGGRTLREGTDYTLSYGNNVNPGTATVTVTGKGNYAGSKSATFQIAAKKNTPSAPSNPSTPSTPSTPTTPTTPVIPNTPATGSGTWTRLWGAGAYDTMRAVVGVDGVFPDGRGGSVIVATGDGYWDALAASGLAGRLDAPVLITPGGALAPQTRAELQRLRPARVYVMGGPLAVSDGCVGQIRQVCGNVTRVYGGGAQDTAVEIWKAGSGWGRTAVIATTNGYYDALSVAPYAFAKAAPIFLASPDSGLNAATVAALRAGGFSRVVIVGGALAVPAKVEQQARSAGATQVVRLWGAGALDTSARIAEFELREGMGLSHMAIASSQGYWDALSAAAVCGRQNSVLVLAPQSGGYTAIDAVYDRGKVAHGHVVGGNLAISDATMRHVTG